MQYCWPPLGVAPVAQLPLPPVVVVLVPVADALVLVGVQRPQLSLQ
jgi:hypothetical protein